MNDPNRVNDDLENALASAAPRLPDPLFQDRMDRLFFEAEPGQQADIPETSGPAAKRRLQPVWLALAAALFLTAGISAYLLQPEQQAKAIPAPSQPPQQPLIVEGPRMPIAPLRVSPVLNEVHQDLLARAEVRPSTAWIQRSPQRPSLSDLRLKHPEHLERSARLAKLHQEHFSTP